MSEVVEQSSEWNGEASFQHCPYQVFFLMLQLSMLPKIMRKVFKYNSDVESRYFTFISVVRGFYDHLSKELQDNDHRTLSYFSVAGK